MQYFGRHILSNFPLEIIHRNICTIFQTDIQMDGQMDDDFCHRIPESTDTFPGLIDGVKACEQKNNCNVHVHAHNEIVTTHLSSILKTYRFENSNN